MAEIIGMRSVADYASGQINWDWADGVLSYDLYGELPLTAFMSRAKTRPTATPRKDWFDEGYDSRVLTVASTLGASTAGSSQTLSVDRGAYFAPATMLLYVQEVDEHLRVTTDPTSNTQITVQRGWGKPAGTAVAAIPQGSSVVLIGTASEEGSGMPTPVGENPYSLFNWTQIFKTPYTITNTDAASDHRTGDPWSEAVAKAAVRHMKDIEFAMLLGKRSETIGPGGKPLRTMGGLIEFVQTNRVNWGGSATLEDIEDFTTEVAKYGNRDIVAFCGDLAITKLNRLVRHETNYVLQAPTKLFGYSVNTLVMPNGVTLRMITHPLLNGHPVFRNSLWCLHPPDLERAPLKGRDTHVVSDILPNGTDGKGEALLTEMTMIVRREKNFGIAVGL